MKKKDISRLLQRYLTGHQEGKDAYFDADEIDELLDSFEESDDYTYYDEVLALGLRLHPGNPDLQIRQCKSYVYNEDYDSALALIESIAETDNQDLDMLRLECYVMQDSYDKVIGHVEKLIANKCEYLETLFEYIAPILGDVEMTKEAHDFINRATPAIPGGRAAHTQPVPPPQQRLLQKKIPLHCWFRQSGPPDAPHVRTCC